MKWLKNLIRKMSLTQQLSLMVVAIFIFLIVFFFGFLSLNIDTFVESQMFNVIHETQDDVIENYLLGRTGSSLFGTSASNMVHVIYEQDSVPLISTNIPLEDSFPGVGRVISDQLKIIEPDMRLNQRFDRSSLISIKGINEQASIVSIMPIEYHNQFRSALINSFVYMIILVVGFVFVLLLIWVGSIIHALNLIKEYIGKSKRNEEAVLKVDRGDEIGELADVLVEMQDELHYQQKQKEEMLQNISHDLKTPVATIKSYSEAIKDGIYPYETLEKSVDVILEHADRLEKKVFNLLMLNRMDYMTHEKVATDQTIDLEQIIEQVIVSIKQIRPEIEINFTSKGSTFIGQEEPWRVVIENLLDNALRYSKTKIDIEVDDHYFTIYNDGEKV
ncbi:MAG TPA: HAMP domain-containing sensor histidine kinase, partial [Erysipelothrix sp.]|nr:HAMP domain-containing sensor histidine kinase [Erysipelothrix sp.]